MLADCHSKNVDAMITKSIFRFGRNTEDTLIALRILKDAGVDVIFETKNIDTSEASSELMISIIEAFAQVKNESRSANIRWGSRTELLMKLLSFTGDAVTDTVTIRTATWRSYPRKWKLCV